MKSWSVMAFLLLLTAVVFFRKEALIEEQRSVIETQTQAIVALCVQASRCESSTYELNQACLEFLEDYAQ